jgi:predicted nucleotidyltransferase
MTDGTEATGDIGQPNTPLLAEIVRRVVEVAHPDRIILFGSAAREEMNADSDYDLLVIKAGIAHRRRLAQEIYRNLFGVAAPVDVVVVTPEDVAELRDALGSIIAPALREGREIYAAEAA